MAKLRGSTKRLWEGLEWLERCEDGPTFPKEYLNGLRMALEAGLSCEQIVSFLVLASGIYECGAAFDEGELLHRSQYIISVMKRDRRLQGKPDGGKKHKQSGARCICREQLEQAAEEAVFESLRSDAGPPSVCEDGS